VAASEEIYREVKRIREEKREDCGVIETRGASGPITSHRGRTKFIRHGQRRRFDRVIAEWVNYGELMNGPSSKSVVFKTASLRTRAIRRDLTPAEQAYMQSLIDNMFGQFVQAVAEGRGMKFDDVEINRTAKCGLANRRSP